MLRSACGSTTKAYNYQRKKVDFNEIQRGEKDDEELRYIIRREREEISFSLNICEPSPFKCSTRASVIHWKKGSLGLRVLNNSNVEEKYVRSFLLIFSNKSHSNARVTSSGILLILCVKFRELTHQITPFPYTSIAINNVGHEFEIYCRRQFLTSLARN